jgi:hypothetical protein
MNVRGNRLAAITIEGDMESLRLDLKYAVRSIGAAPRFAAIVMVTLALGTGANTAVFSVLNAVVLKPLRYEEAGRLVRVYHASPGDNKWLSDRPHRRRLSRW